jgi:hypothetical protein
MILKENKAPLPDIFRDFGGFLDTVERSSSENKLTQNNEALTAFVYS